MTTRSQSLADSAPAGIAPPLPEVDAMEEMEHAGPRAVAAQQEMLSPAWRNIDRSIILVTEFTLFLVGALFTVMITLAALTRYVFDFSLFFVDASARLLLVWFFLLGAGIALRHGAHVGFELLLSWMSPRKQRTTRIVGYLFSLLFFIEMLWGGLYAMGPAASQTEAGLNISLVWIVAAVPAGFLLLTYHIIVLIYGEIRKPLPTAPLP